MAQIREPRQVRYCYECGRKIDPTRPSCWYCGTETRRAVRPAPKCQFCGSELPYNAIKCRHCGEWLDGRPRTESMPAPAPAPAQIVFVVDRTLLGSMSDRQLPAGRPVPPEIAARLDPRTVKAIEQGHPAMIEGPGVRALPAPEDADIIDVEQDSAGSGGGGALARREGRPLASAAGGMLMRAGRAMGRALAKRASARPAADPDTIDAEGEEIYRICDSCSTEILNTDNYCYHCGRQFHMSALEMRNMRRGALHVNATLYLVAATMILAMVLARRYLPFLTEEVTPGQVRPMLALAAAAMAGVGIWRRPGLINRAIGAGLIVATVWAWVFM